MALRADWKFTAVTAVSDLESFLPKKFLLRSLETINRELIVLDDFYWHIWQAGFLLTRDKRDGLLSLWGSDESCLETVSASPECCFWWQLPKGNFADELKKLLALRAFTPKCGCRLTTESLAIINRDEKIVARIKLFTLRWEDEQLTSFLTIYPLRGYGSVYQATVTALSSLAAETVEPLNVRQLLRLGGLKVAPPVDKGVFYWCGNELAETVVCKMAQSMLLSARQYEAGLVADIDTEFVHQYRVNIRKCRSMVRLFKKALSPQRYQLLKAELKVLGSRTNDLRDLDVFLLDADYYREMLPEYLQLGLKQIFNRVKRRRASAMKKVIAELQSDSYQVGIAQLLQTLQAEPERIGKHAQLPIKPLVAKKVLAQYRQIGSDGGEIDAETEDDVIHELRIECKKLRYLLELFSELFDKKKIKVLVRHLKGLQDNLGRFNDYSVQREFIAGFSRGERVSPEQLASINGLAAVLFNKQLLERSLLAENIAGFTVEKVRGKFEKLFAQPCGEESTR